MFPAVIDNNIRKKFVACPTKMKWAHIENLRPISESTVDMHFGRCFATGVEWARKFFYYEQGSPAGSVDAGIGEAVKAWGDFAEGNVIGKSAFVYWPFLNQGDRPGRFGWSHR